MEGQESGSASSLAREGLLGASLTTGAHVSLRQSPQVLARAGNPPEQETASPASAATASSSSRVGLPHSLSFNHLLHSLHTALQHAAALITVWCALFRVHPTYKNAHTRTQTLPTNFSSVNVEAAAALNCLSSYNEIVGKLNRLWDDQLAIIQHVDDVRFMYV